MKLRVRIPRVSLGPKGRRWIVPAVWILGGGALAGLVFGVSFYLSIQSVLRSNEVDVPDVAGLSFDAAAERVGPLGLVLQIADQRHDPATPSGHVIEQMPPPDFSVRRGRKVKVVLSLGDEVLEVPNLVGQAARAVELELRQQGFVTGDLARVASYDAPSGTVIAQVPPASTPSVPRTRVHRLVSDGPPPRAWVMPDLRGVSRERAEEWIVASGFRRGTVRRVRMVGRPSDTVVGQLPLPGYPVRGRDVIELTLAQ